MLNAVDADYDDSDEEAEDKNNKTVGDDTEYSQNFEDMSLSVVQEDSAVDTTSRRLSLSSVASSASASPGTANVSVMSENMTVPLQSLNDLIHKNGDANQSVSFHSCRLYHYNIRQLFACSPRLGFSPCVFFFFLFFPHIPRVYPSDQR